jgi:hypothetical protein
MDLNTELKEIRREILDMHPTGRGADLEMLADIRAGRETLWTALDAATARIARLSEMLEKAAGHMERLARWDGFFSPKGELVTCIKEAQELLAESQP